MEQTTVRIDPEHFSARLLQDCLNQATAAYWLRRAEWFETCNPALALNCRRHAWLLSTASDEPTDEVWEALRGA